MPSNAAARSALPRGAETRTAPTPPKAMLMGRPRALLASMVSLVGAWGPSGSAAAAPGSALFSASVTKLGRRRGGDTGSARSQQSAGISGAAAWRWAEAPGRLWGLRPAQLGCSSGPESPAPGKRAKGARVPAPPYRASMDPGWLTM
jgi:hypothetical protein